MMACLRTDPRLLLDTNPHQHPKQNAEESWVACDSCQQWVHQVCALYNARNDQGEAVKYYCPSCTLKRRKNNAQPVSKIPPLSARFIKHSKFSAFVEARCVGPASCVCGGGGVG